MSYSKQSSTLSTEEVRKDAGKVVKNSGKQGIAVRKPAARKKVPFEKGYSQMDWLKLTQTHPDLAGLKGQSNKRLIPMSEVKEHRTEGSMWTVLKGHVYNISPYMKFHPGDKEINTCNFGQVLPQNYLPRSHLTVYHNLIRVTKILLLFHPPAMAEAILFNVTVDIIFKLGSSTLRDLGSLWHVKVELEKLEHSLTTIQAVLHDVEEKQFKDHAVKVWVSRLKDVSYEIDDLIHESSYQTLRRQVLDGMSSIKELVTFYWKKIVMKINL